MMAKAEVRHAALARRAAVSAVERAAFAGRLGAMGPRLVADYAPPNATLIVALFQPIGTEPDPGPLAEALALAGVPLALPVAGPRGEALVFRRWSPGEPTLVGRYGIPEPVASAAAVDPDVLFVPLAAFDRRGHRIGTGAGYYDRTLSALRARKRIKAIGLAFAVQEELFIPSEDHDEPLDLVLTDRETLICEP